MADITLGVFATKEDAENALSDLTASGFSAQNISVLMREGETVRNVVADTGTNVASSAVSGATTGGVLAGLAGLLVGVGAITIPGLGAILIGGPLVAALGLTGVAATTVSAAVTGAAAGGLVGGLMGLGLPEEEAQIYETRVREGGILIALSDWTDDPAEARQILRENGASQVDTVASV